MAIQSAEKVRETEPGGERPDEVEREDQDEGGGGDEKETDVRADKDGDTEVEIHHESRRERRARLYREERQAAIDEALKPIRDQNAQLARQLTELSGIMRQPLQPIAPAQQQKQDEDDEAYSAIKRKQADVIARIRTAKADDLPNLQKEWERLERQSVLHVSEAAAKRALSEYKPPAQPNAHEQMLRAEFSDVFGHQKALGYAWAVFAQARDEAEARGEPFNYADGHKAALTKAAQVFGLRKAPPPPAQQRQRFAAPGGSVSGQRATSVTRKLTKEERRMAIASESSSLSEDERIARWTRKMEKAGYWDEDK